MNAKVGDAWKIAAGATELPTLQPVTAQPLFRPLYTSALRDGPECVWVFENLDKLYAWHEATKAHAPADSKFSDFCSDQFKQQQDVEYSRQEPPDDLLEDDSDDEDDLDIEDDEVPW